MCKKVFNNNPKWKKYHQHASDHQQLHQIQTKIISHTTNCKRIIEVEGGWYIIILSSLGVVVVGGKTSHLILVGGGGWWYQVSGTRCTRFAMYIFFCRELFLSTCVPGTYQQPTIWLYIHRMIWDWMMDEVVVAFMFITYAHKICGWATLCYWCECFHNETQICYTILL